MVNLTYNAPLFLNKQNCRKHLKEVRLTISPLRRLIATQAAYEALTVLCQTTPYILSYMSFGSELSLLHLNEQLAQEKRLVLPRIVEDNLLFFITTDLKSLQTNRWGIQEPLYDSKMLFNPKKNNSVLVPGLGFDPFTNHRLGYGKGYYDRFFSCNPFTIKYGVGFHEQAFTPLPCHSTDQSLTHILLF